MDQKKQTGFLLFPQPPTPPTRRRRTTTVSTRSSSSGSIQSVKKSRTHGRKLSTSSSGQVQPSLIPAPLKLRKASDEIPPIPKLLPALEASTLAKTTTKDDERPNIPIRAPPLPPSTRKSSLQSSPRTPTRNGNRFKSRTVAEFIELDAGSETGDTKRLSQWLDLEDGEVDRRRLSRYLGSILGSTFEVPNLETSRRESLALLRRMSRQELQSLAEQYEQERCECPPDTIICHCSSSPEFEQNSSISSTVCLLGVPRARFHPAFFDVEPAIAELPSPQISSPPGLSYDNADNSSESGDWSTPRTPSTNDVFMGASSNRSYSSKIVIASPSSPGPSTPSKLQSFSRPFRPDSTIRCLSLNDSLPSTPTRKEQKCSNSSKPFLTSISTVSSFDFDFDIKARRRSLAQQKLRTERASDKDDSNHSRTSSAESLASNTSQHEISTATAAVTMSRANFKPTLITNTGRRARTPQPATPIKHSISTTSSAKSSTSSFSIPEYWHQYNAGVRPRSRSTTQGSKSSIDSIALSAFLTMPLLSPKKISNPMPGNAFAQRSNTTVTMPSKLPSSSALDQFDFGTGMRETEQTLARSNTTPPILTSYTSQSGQPTDNIDESNASDIANSEAAMNNDLDDNMDDDPNDNVDDNENDSDVDDHLHAYVAANARFKAYMDSMSPSTSPSPAPDPTSTLTQAINAITNSINNGPNYYDNDDYDYEDEYNDEYNYSYSNDPVYDNDSNPDHDKASNPHEQEAWTGLGMTHTSTSKRNSQAYLCLNDDNNDNAGSDSNSDEDNRLSRPRTRNRPHIESGVFGRMSPPGTIPSSDVDDYTRTQWNGSDTTRSVSMPTSTPYGYQYQYPYPYRWSTIAEEECEET